MLETARDKHFDIPTGGAMTKPLLGLVFRRRGQLQLFHFLFACRPCAPITQFRSSRPIF
jgi:hypothetical protein